MSAITDFACLLTLQLGTGYELCVHTDAICSKSNFFETMRRAKFREMTTKIIPLPEETDNEAFQVLVGWVYASSVAISDHLHQHRSSALDGTFLARLYVIADRYVIPLLQNDIIEMFHESDTVGDLEEPINTLETLYNELGHQSSGLYTYLADTLVEALVLQPWLLTPTLRPDKRHAALHDHELSDRIAKLFEDQPDLTLMLFKQTIAVACDNQQGGTRLSRDRSNVHTYYHKLH